MCTPSMVRVLDESMMPKVKSGQFISRTLYMIVKSHGTKTGYFLGVSGDFGTCTDQCGSFMTLWAIKGNTALPPKLPPFACFRGRRKGTCMDLNYIC